jgi:preprotein translocase subunit SecB
MPTRTAGQTKRKSKDDKVPWEEWTKGVEIREVAADAVDFQVERGRLATKKAPTVQIQFRLEPKARSVAAGEAMLLFEFELFMSEQAAAAPTEPLLRTRLVYHATYSLPGKLPTTDEHLKRFQEQIAIAHVFPFVRAQLADLIMRAGLPPLYLPLAQPARDTQR